MIKLEDLKVGDKIYGVAPDGPGLYEESIVERELLMLDMVPQKAEAVICAGGMEIVLRRHEQYLFRTRKEAEECLDIIALKLAKELLNSDKFIDRLFECATSPKRLSKYGEYSIFEIAVELYKKNLKENAH